MLNAGDILQGRYRIVKPVGQGGFGAVYRGWDLSLKQPVAVKENSDGGAESQRRFEHEARLLAGLRHTNLPAVIDHFILPGQGQYLVMDFVEGKSLGDLLDERGGPLTEAEALPWMLQVCDALTFLHTRTPPIIHRDIKPDNVIVTADGRAVLVDFGISKVYDPSKGTTVGAKAVTPGYSPPEQYGRGGTDARSDVYSLGATLYTLLTGRTPPEAPDLSSGADALTPPHQLNPLVGAATSRAVMEAMELVMGRRLDSAAAFGRRLSSPSATVAAGGGMAAIPMPGAPVVVAPTVAAGNPAWDAPPPPVQPARRALPFGVWVAGALAVLALIAGAALYFRNGDSPPDATPEATTLGEGAPALTPLATVTATEAAATDAPSPTTAAAATAPPDPTKTSTPTPEPPPTPTTPPLPTAIILTADAASFTGRNPLTGEEASDAALKQRPIAVKIDNDPNARPQSGLNDADTVYEHVIEGGITRFTAIFYDTTPPEAGPVRSGRLIDGELLAMYDAVLAHTNPSAGLRQWFRDAGYGDRLFGESSAGFYRKPPDGVHSVYVRLDQLWGAVSAEGLNTSPRFTAYNAFSEEPPTGGAAAGSVHVSYPNESVEWVYDPGSGRYQRWMDGERHVDANGGQVTAANVIQLSPVHTESGVCAHETNDVCDAWSHDIQLRGSGPAIVYRDGLRYDVTYHGAENGQLTFTDGGGAFPLRIGNSWVQVMP